LEDISSGLSPDGSWILAQGHGRGTPSRKGFSAGGRGVALNNECRGQLSARGGETDRTPSALSPSHPRATRSPLPTSRQFLLLLLLLAAAIGLAGTGLSLDQLRPALLLYTAWTGLLLALVFRGGGLLDHPGVLLVGALVLRLLFLPVLPDLSDDPFRYVWDGWLLATGVNPYLHAPSDPSLVGRQGEILFQGMNSRDFFSVYPPLSQWLFLPAGWMYERVGWDAAYLTLKASVTAVEILGLLALWRGMIARGIRLRLLALYAWNPLVVVAVAGVGHSEGGLILGVGLLVLGILSARPTLAWLGLGLAVMSKVIPLLLAPLLLRHHLQRQGTASTVRAMALGSLPALVLTLPFLTSGLPLRALDSAALYLTLFEFNAGIHQVFRWALNGIPMLNGAWAGPLLAGLFLALALGVWRRARVEHPGRLLQSFLLLLGLYLVTATTVHPWYLLWGLPFLPLVDRWRLPWLWAGWAAFPTYLVYVGFPALHLSLLFWGGVFLLLLREEWPTVIRPFLLEVAGRRKARQVAPYVEGPRMLDLGAGEGFVGARLQAMGAGGARRGNRTKKDRVFLADVEPNFQVALPGFRFDGDRLPLRDNSVDTVLLSLVLHHAARPDLLLREALRVARSRVVITESTYLWRWERDLLERADRWVNRGRGGEGARWDAAPLHFDTARGWERRVEEAGGRVLVSRRLNRIGHRHHLLVVEPGGPWSSSTAS